VNRFCAVQAPGTVSAARAGRVTGSAVELWSAGPTTGPLYLFLDPDSRPRCMSHAIQAVCISSDASRSSSKELRIINIQAGQYLTTPAGPGSMGLEVRKRTVMVTARMKPGRGNYVKRQPYKTRPSVVEPSGYLEWAKLLLSSATAIAAV